MDEEQELKRLRNEVYRLIGPVQSFKIKKVPSNSDVLFHHITSASISISH